MTNDTPTPSGRLWAPWRMSYITRAVSADRPNAGCVFCRRDDLEDDLVIERRGPVFAILNKYPYVRGHAMVCPRRHVGSWAELDADERRALVRETARIERALQQAYAPERVHVGSNVGRDAGAGVPGHLHVHLVPEVPEDRPRQVPPDGRELPEPLVETCRRLREALS